MHPASKITDDEIVALYVKGTALKKIPANDERIRRVLTERNINKREARRYVRQHDAAEPHSWEERLKQTAKMGLPPSLPRHYTGPSRLKAKLIHRRQQEAEATA